MTASLRRTVIVTMAALGVAVLLAWAASTGPGAMIGTSAPGTEPVTTTTTDPVRPVDPAPSTGRGSLQDQLPSDSVDWLQSVLGIVVVLLGIGVLVSAGRALFLRVARELPEKQLVLDADPLPDAERGRKALGERQDSYREALDGSDVRNAIVACWVLLEETAADAGVERRPAETATEFVVRFLHALDVDPRPVATLAQLFHEARFSTHDLPADAREHARGALDGIRVGLDRSGQS